MSRPYNTRFYIKPHKLVFGKFIFFKFMKEWTLTVYNISALFDLFRDINVVDC